VRKLLLVGLAVAAFALPALAQAHPLGNFTTNRYSRVELSGNGVYVLYVLDLAEIPTFQARGELERLGRDAYASSLARKVRRGLTLEVDGERRTLHELRHAISFPAGVGGLETTRLEIVLDAGRARGSRVRLSYEDGSFPSRIGWKEIVVAGEGGASIAASTAPAESASDELRVYPKELIGSPLDVTRAVVTYTPGTGGGTPPSLGGERAGRAGEGGFASLIQEEDVTVGFALVAVFVAMFWGAAHALTPGHGKAIVAAYMVGSRGTARHAALLGLIVTVTHTIGVFALGFVTLGLSEFVVPETLYPWLNLISAALVVLVGLTVLRLRILDWLRPSRRAARAGHHHHHDHHDDHHHHDHHHGHRHGHEHGHSHAPEPGSGIRGLVAVGVSGGLLPCPTALVVLLAAISLHRVGFGLVLIVAFSIGLAATDTGIGLLAVGAKRLFGGMSFEGRLVRALPAVSALVIVALGVAMTVRAFPAVG
jgi:ABC-type nickel/cobalt efflux system permease component RcnA